KCRHFAALAGKSRYIAAVGETLSEPRRKIARECRVCMFGSELAAPRLTQGLHVPERLGDRRFEIGEVDGLHQEIEGAAVHRGTDVDNIAIGRNDDGCEVGMAFLELLDEREAV